MTTTAAPATQPEARPKSRRWIRAALLGALALGAAAAVEWAFFSRRAKKETELVLQGNIDVRQVDLSFKVDGRIETVAVDEGDAVKAGELLATLDKRYFHDDLREARAQRESAAANLEKLQRGSRPEEITQARAQLKQQQANAVAARANYERAEMLVPSGGVSKEDLDQRRQALEVGEANVKYAEAALKLAVIGPRKEDVEGGRAQLFQQEAATMQAELRLSDSELVAPNDGVILTRAREPGAIVKTGETVLTLTLTSPVWVRTYVDERDLGIVRPGMVASVITDSAPSKPYSARVGFVSPTAEFTPKSVETRKLRTDLVYRLRVLVDNPDGGLRQGMPVTVVLPLAEPRPAK